MIYFAVYCPFHDNDLIASKAHSTLDECHSTMIDAIKEYPREHLIEEIDIYVISETKEITFLERWHCNSRNGQWGRIE